MLETALQHRVAFTQMKVVDPNFKCCPTEEEWDRAEKIANFLKPFYDTTTLFSGCKYPTSNLYFLNIWRIRMVLEEEIDSGDLFVKEMAGRMMKNFNKYWERDSLVLSLAVVFDPRYKLNLVDFCYSKLGYQPFEVQKLVKHVRDKLYRLFEKYKNISVPSPQCKSTSERAMDVRKGRDLLEDFDPRGSQRHGPNVKKSQLDLYLEEEPLDRKLHPELDVLSYWKGASLRFPELGMMARDVLSVPITSVASESAFSIGGQIFGKYRNSLLSSNVEALLCTRDWLNVAHDSDEEDDEKALVVDLERKFQSPASSNIV